jgi:hypothetical protein
LNLPAMSIIFGATSFYSRGRLDMRRRRVSFPFHKRPGKYFVILDSGKALLTKEVNVGKENQAVQKVDVRK